jgi:hypothetical protein
MNPSSAAMKAASTATEAATSAAARIRIIGDESCSEQNKCRQTGENVFEHRAPPDLEVREGASLLRLLRAMLT